jgi:hypothetical protein
MSIKIYIATRDDWPELIITKLLRMQYGLDDDWCVQIYEEHVKPHLDVLREGICILAETAYVDFFYRDSYYHYFSSKLKSYHRDCLRLSLFSGEVSENDFADPDKYDDLKQRYLGFYVLRPTFPNVVGRSVISPKALENNDIRICSCVFNTTVCGLKFQVSGFPHASQDTEIITCAETTLWAIMEYFGGKYSYYKPTLPSKIIQQLQSISFERQIPSRGLNVHQISYALKEYGFGTRIYSREGYGGEEFEKLLSCYVESGIPLVVALENDASDIAHALLVVGRENDCSDRVESISCFLEKERNITIYDYDSVPKRFVFVDDNKPVYRKACLSDPAAHYDSDSWKQCKITHFIVPLYPKIYLEAYEAKRHIRKFLLFGPHPINENAEIVLKIFLASSRSYKHELMRDKGVKGDMKTLIEEMSMPKFIWIGEISTMMDIRGKKANGLVILDATEPSRQSLNNPLIMAAYDGNFFVVNSISGKLEKKKLHYEPFSIYEHNLKSQC